LKFIEYIKKHKKLIILIIVVTLFDVGVSYLRVYNSRHGLFKGELLGPYKVTKIADGDTIWVRDNIEYPKGVKVRFIGIDCPESAAPENYLEKTGKTNSTAGEQVANYVERLLKGKDVYLEFDVRTEDKYGRLLAYVYLDGAGNEMVQEILLTNGFAQIDTVPPNVKFEERFYLLQKEAREKKMGLWADPESVFFSEK